MYKEIFFSKVNKTNLLLSQNLKPFNVNTVPDIHTYINFEYEKIFVISQI